MATSKPTIDTAPKRLPIPKQRTSPPTLPTITSMRKPETTGTRQNPNAPVPLSPSTTKRSTAALSKTVTTTSTSRVKSPKPKKNPSLTIASSKDKVHGIKAHKEGVLSPKPPSPKPKTESAITRASSGVRTSTKVVNTSAPIRGRSPVAGSKTVKKVGDTAKPASKRSPSLGAKTGTRGSLTRVNSAPNLIKEVPNLHGGKVIDVPVEEEKYTNMSPDLDNKDEQTELIQVPSSMEEEVKEGHVDTGGENDGQSETYAENGLHEEEKEPIEEVTSKTIVIAEPVSIPSIPVPDVTVPDVPVPDAQVPDVPVPVARVAAAKVSAHEKKEAGTSNAAIEETRSKLIGERKSKVLALVGAFESVM